MIGILPKDVLEFILKLESHLFFCLQLLVDDIIVSLFCFLEL